ncbi:Uncharacterized protein Fot_06248 [Forsythia ovata]|uniref:Uncharacterized protein n=1 Tax=Forsythia ovata TaxID=205694 RepID=A0ABD1WSE6_9LAMI
MTYRLLLNLPKEETITRTMVIKEIEVLLMARLIASPDNPPTLATLILNSNLTMLSDYTHQVTTPNPPSQLTPTIIPISFSSAPKPLSPHVDNNSPQARPSTHHKETPTSSYSLDVSDSPPNQANLSHTLSNAYEKLRMHSVGLRKS